MPDFNAVMHQNRFRLGLHAPQTSLGELTALPRPRSGFKGPTSKVKEGEGRGRSTCLPPRFDNPGYGPGASVS